MYDQGSLAHRATDISEPGVIHHTEGNRISFGEPDGSTSDWVKAVVDRALEELVRHPDTSRLVCGLMVETNVVAGKLGIELPISIEQRMAGASPQTVARSCA